jgi:hypothetical protein
MSSEVDARFLNAYSPYCNLNTFNTGAVHPISLLYRVKIIRSEYSLMAVQPAHVVGVKNACVAILTE